VQTLEHTEDAVASLAWYPDSGIRYFNEQLRPLGPDPDRDRPLGRRELHCVRDEIEQDLAYPRGIHEQWAFPFGVE
jgi:hypothetical protein